MGGDDFNGMRHITYDAHSINCSFHRRAQVTHRLRLKFTTRAIKHPSVDVPGARRGSSTSYRLTAGARRPPRRRDHSARLECLTVDPVVAENLSDQKAQSSSCVVYSLKRQYRVQLWRRLAPDSTPRGLNQSIGRSAIDQRATDLRVGQVFDLRPSSQ